MPGQVEINKPFPPNPNFKNLYRLYASPLLIIFLLVSLITLQAGFPPSLTVIWIIFLIPTAFVYYWINKYYESISFMLTENEVVVEKGVWFQKTHNVPYRLIMNINTSQGPISRRFGIGRANIETAGHSGGKSEPEAAIFGVENFVEVKDKIMEIIKGTEGVQVGEEGEQENINSETLKELQKIRKILEERENNA